MDGTRPFLSVLCSVLLLTATGSFAADKPASPPNQDNPFPQPAVSSHGVVGRISDPYRPKTVAPPTVGNSGRLDSLLRAGNLYLSLADTIALALENNLDIELQRYGPQIADTNLLRAQAGGFASPVSTSVTAGPSSVTGSGPSSGLQSFILAGSTQIGSAPPSFDPTLTGSGGLAHLTSPQSSSFTTGTNSLIQRQITSTVGVQQNFETGTLVSLGLTNSNSDTNSNRAQFNPSTNSSLALNVTQHLLQGFGPALNSRQIRIAKNNREV